MKPVLVSGIQPTGRLHIGNYLGALKNFVDLQNSGEYDCYFFIADLHALTENPDPKDLSKNIVNLAADFLAAGLDPKKSTLYRHSEIHEHSELAWILNTITSLGDLMRMTQFTDKSTKSAMPHLSGKVISVTMSPEEMSMDYVEHTKKAIRQEVGKYIYAGLLNYPVLMAADILMYNPKFVPVGDDQLQHLELTRTLARKFNSRFGKTFIEPQPLLTKTPRVMSLRDPEKKMSKSQPESCLFIDDSPEEIKAKIARATTDSGSEIGYDRKKKPGLSNLLEIYSALCGKEPKAVAKEFAGKNYSDFKKELSELVANYFADFREKKKSLLANPKSIAATLRAGSEKAAEVAEKKMAEVKQKVGLVI